jgi:hypothetical protein
MDLWLAFIFSLTEKPSLLRAEAISVASLTGFARGDDLYAPLPMTRAILRSLADMAILEVNTTNAQDMKNRDTIDSLHLLISISISISLLRVGEGYISN